MNKLLLIIFSVKNSDIEFREIDVLEEHSKKYKVEAIFPFDSYQYFHKHNLNVIQNSSTKGIYYIVSTSKKQALISLRKFLNKRLAYHCNGIKKIKLLDKEFGLQLQE